MDQSPPGSSVHGILQARILEWVAMPSSRGPSRPRDQTHSSCLWRWQAGSFPLVSFGKPPAPLGHFKNKREIELMYCGSSLVAVYPPTNLVLLERLQGLRGFPASPHSLLKPLDTNWMNKVHKRMKIIQIVGFVYTLFGTPRNHQATDGVDPDERTENMW